MSDEDARLLAWRVEQLERLGCGYAVALDLALAGVDWHRLASLIGAGCPLERAIEIVT